MPSICPHCGIRVRPSASRCPQCDGTLFGDAPGAASGWSLSDGPDAVGGAPAAAGGPTGAERPLPPYPPSGEVGWPSVGPPPPSKSDRDFGMLAHLSAFVTFVGIPSFLGPLVVWLWKREQHPFIDEHAREALNFNLSMFLYGMAAVVIAIATLGLALLVLLPIGLAFAVAYFILVIIAAMSASRGEHYRYPLTIRFLS